MGNEPMIREADAVVVGSGAFGASIAFHLARRGKRVALVDRYDLASQTSPRAAGLTAQVRGTDLMTRLATLSVRAIERFAADTGEPIAYHQTGSLKLARSGDWAEHLREDVERGQRLGLDVDFVSPAEARRLSPLLNPDGVRAATYTATDLYLDPAQLPVGYARAAGRLGVALLPNTAVTGIRRRGGAVAGVSTDRGEIAAPCVVLAAGPWTGELAAGAGVSVPVVPTRHQLLITEPIDGVEDRQPIVRLLDLSIYVRPERGGLMVGGYEPDPVQYAAGPLPAGFQTADLPLDPGVVLGLAEQVSPEFPALRGARIRELRGGLPTLTADGLPIVGPLSRLPGCFVATGCCVGGLSISPAVGSVLADWIADGAPPFDLSPLSPDRFPADLAGQPLAAAARAQYAHPYAAH